MNPSTTATLRQRVMLLSKKLRQEALGQGLAGQLLRGGIGAAAVKVASLAFTFAVTIVLARALGAQEFGLYSFIIALVTVMAVPSQFGLPSLVLRETARSVATDDYGRLLGSWRWSSRITFLMSLAVIALGLIAAVVLGSTVPALQSTAYRFGLLLIPLLSLGALRAGALRGLGKVVQGLLPELVLIPALLVVFMGTVWLVSPASLDATSAMAAHALAAGAAFLIGLAFLYRGRPKALTSDIEPIYDLEGWRNSALPMAIIMGVGVLFRHTDTVMLGLLTTEEHVGVYRVASQWAWLVTFGSQIVNFAIPPFIARFYAQDDSRRLQTIAKRAGAAGALSSLPPLLVFVLAGKPVISFALGPSYEGAYLPLVILATGQFASVLMGSCGTLLAMTNYERDTATVLGVSVLANIGLNALFIPLWGPLGAAMVSAAVLFGYNVVLRKIVRLRLGIEPSVLWKATA